MSGTLPPELSAVESDSCKNKFFNDKLKTIAEIFEIVKCIEKYHLVTIINIYIDLFISFYNQDNTLYNI